MIEEQPGQGAFVEALQERVRARAAEVAEPMLQAAPPDHLYLRLERWRGKRAGTLRSEEHTSELQSRQYLVCRLLLEKKPQQAHSVSDQYYSHPQSYNLLQVLRHSQLSSK